MIRTVPTGPKPIVAMFNGLAGTSIGFLARPGSRVGRGYGLPLSKGTSFGCCKSWRAAKYPVGKMSARRIRELSARAVSQEPVAGCGSISSKRKRVPPA